MCIKALEWARRQRTGSPTLKAVLRAIADYADEDGRAWPSQLRLAEDTELSDRAVREALKTLEERGMLVRSSRRRPDNSRATDIIELSMKDESSQRLGEADAEVVPEPPSGTPTGTTFRYPYRNHVPEVPEPRSGLTTFEPPLNHQKKDTLAQIAPDAGGTGVSDAAWHVMIEKLIEMGVARPAAKSFLGKTIRALGKRSGDIVTAVCEVQADPLRGGDPLQEISEALKIEKPKRKLHVKGGEAPSRKYPWPENFREIFWQKYPLKKDKLKAIRVLEFIYGKDSISFSVIMDGVDRLVAAKIELRFNPHPTTYLRNERWTDVYPVPSQDAKATRAAQASLWASDAIEADHEIRGKNGTEPAGQNLDEWHRPSDAADRHLDRSAAQSAGGDTRQFPPLRLVGGS